MGPQGPAGGPGGPVGPEGPEGPGGSRGARGARGSRGSSGSRRSTEGPGGPEGPGGCRGSGMGVHHGMFGPPEMGGSRGSRVQGVQGGGSRGRYRPGPPLLGRCVRGLSAIWRSGPGPAPPAGRVTECRRPIKNRWKTHIVIDPPSAVDTGHRQRHTPPDGHVEGRTNAGAADRRGGPSGGRDAGRGDATRPAIHAQCILVLVLPHTTPTANPQ